MALSVQGLRFTYDGPLIDDATFTVENGESVFILGPSGAGKSTILRCIAGLEAPEAGSIHIDGRDLRDVPTHQRHVGMLFQEPALFPNMDIARNVAFGLSYQDVPKSARHSEAMHWLDVVGLADRHEAAIDELSGGERQRVALARTLAARPKAVLLDEPLSALDRDLRDDLGDRLKVTLAEQGVPAVWVTHDEGEARRLGDHVLRLRGRRLVTA